MSGILNAVVGAGGVAAPTDTYFKNTTLLLHGNGTNGAQNNTFLDSSTNNFTITRNGNTTQGTFTPFSQPDGWWSNYFAGSQSINAPASTDFQFTGDFTLEAWYFQTSTGEKSVFVQNSGANYLALNVNVGTGFNLYLNSPGPTISPTDIVPQVNQWNHIAVVRSGSTVKVYLNGVASSTTATSSTSTIGYNAVFYVGAVGTQSAGSAIGYISNARVVNGTAIYTSNFTPSTSPLSAVTNTKLLTCQSNYFKDNSTNAFAITVNGSPSVQAFSPFAPTTAYSTSTNGGSGYFDGSGDYLSTPTSGQFTAAGDFTVSCWFYLQSFAATYYGVGGNWSAGTSDEWLIHIQNNGAIRFLTSADASFSSSGVVSLNQWTYFTATRTGTTVTVQVNGTTVKTYTKSDTLGSATKSINIGQQPSNYWPWNGYIADFRLVSGSAVTTLPTTPATAISGTSLLLSSTNSGIFDNASKNDLETVGNAQISTTQSKFGGSSMYFDGTGDYLVSPSNTGLAFGTGDFTAEFWLYCSSVIASDIFQCTTQLSGAIVGPIWCSLFGASKTLNFGIHGNAAYQIDSGWTPAANTWYHIAITRASGTTKIFVNGNTVVTSTAQNGINTTQNGFVLGFGAVTGVYFNGYIDDFRITAGIARYTANFTVSSAAFPNQ